MSSPHAGATPDWALTSRASGQGQQDRWRINRQNGVVSKAAPGLGSLSGARVRQRRGRRDLGVRPGRQRRRRGCWAALSRGCGRGPTSLRLPPAPRSWARPSLAQHWGSATRTGRAPSRPRAHAPSSPLRAVVSPALVGGLPGGRSRDPSPASASRRTVGASVAGARGWRPRRSVPRVSQWPPQPPARAALGRVEETPGQGPCASLLPRRPVIYRSTAAHVALCEFGVWLCAGGRRRPRRSSQHCPGAPRGPRASGSPCLGVGAHLREPSGLLPTVCSQQRGVLGKWDRWQALTWGLDSGPRLACPDVGRRRECWLRGASVDQPVTHLSSPLSSPTPGDLSSAPVAAARTCRTRREPVEAVGARWRACRATCTCSGGHAITPRPPHVSRGSSLLHRCGSQGLQRGRALTAGPEADGSSPPSPPCFHGRRFLATPEPLSRVRQAFLWGPSRPALMPCHPPCFGARVAFWLSA